MRKLFFFIAIIVCCNSCNVSHSARLTINIPDLTGPSVVTLYLGDGTEMEIPINSSAAVSVSAPAKSPQYAYLNYRYVERVLWLTPDADISITFNNKEYHNRVDISGGKGAAESIYLNSGLLKPAYFDDTIDSQESYIELSDKVYAENLAVLNGAGLSRKFRVKEAKRLKYYTNSQLTLFSTYSKNVNPDAELNLIEDKIAELTVFDGSLLDSKEYKNFILDIVRSEAQKEYTGVSAMDGIIQYVENKIDDSAVCEYIVNDYIYSAVSRKGLAVAEHYKDVFFKYVKSQRYLDAFNEICKKWGAIEPGCPSPDFQAFDIEGKNYSLADFKGKYVFIDIWATWCEPCKAEIPYLEALVEKYTNNDIAFVSISCDTNQDAWKKMLSEGMRGNQLHFSDNDTFLDSYFISSIPRFIFIDKEGKIISNDMTRPSNSQTVATLDSLL